MNRMKMKMSGIMIALVAMLLMGSMMTAYAADHQVPDLNKKGSIRIHIQDQEEAVPGGNLNLYRVADVKTDDGNYFFEETEEFAAAKLLTEKHLKLETPISQDLVEKMAEYAEENLDEKIELQIDELGNAKAEELTLGLYLVVQTVPAKGYEIINPFLVTIPMYNGEAYTYDVDASPKVQTLQPKTEEPNPEKPSNPGTPGTHTTLPKTGQLWWPVWVLLVIGLFLFGLGWSRKERT